jgi:hypothetical protein
MTRESAPSTHPRTTLMRSPTSDFGNVQLEVSSTNDVTLSGQRRTFHGPYGRVYTIGGDGNMLGKRHSSIHAQKRAGLLP